MLSFIKEFYSFLKERKKYWLLPIIIILALFGALIVLRFSSAPFITQFLLSKYFIIMGK